MSTITMSSNSKSTSLAVPKLRDNGRNWADYEPRIRKALGSKGLWRHVEGTAVAPKPYVIADGIPVLSDGKTPATNEQLETKETRIYEFEKREYLAQHIILSTTSTRLGANIKDFDTTKEMWDVVKADATTKSTLYILDAEDQLSSMKLDENDDPKTHLMELKQHFQLMLQRRDNLVKMGSTILDTCFKTIIMSSLPELYRPTLQTITAAKRANKLTGGKSTGMKHADLVASITEEAQHRVINDEQSKNAELALAAHAKRTTKNRCMEKSKHEDGSDKEQEEECENCHKLGHCKKDCWAKGSEKEGQGPWQNKGKKADAAAAAVVVTNEESDEMFAFTCTSNYIEDASSLKTPKSKLGTCLDSGASTNYSPDHSMFSNY